VGVAHLALDLGPGHQRRHRVDDEDVEGSGADQHVGDLEGLFPGVGLGDEEFVDVDPDGAGVDRVEGVLGVDEGGDAAVALGLGHDVEGEAGLAGGLGAVDLDDPAPGTPPTPRARSRERAPVEMTSTLRLAASPIFMTAPLPYWRSIWETAMSSDFWRSMLCSFSLMPSSLWGVCCK
jgi:hypothetical protein